MKQLRFTTTKPYSFMGERDLSPIALPKKIGELVIDELRTHKAYIHERAEILAGFDIPLFIDGNLAQLALPFEDQDILMILPDGEYKCKSVYNDTPGSRDCYLISLYSD